jgi:hypothetical protein
MGETPVVCAFSPDDVCLAKGEEAREPLTQVALPDENVLAVERGLHAPLDARDLI